MARPHFGSNRGQTTPKKIVGKLRKTQLVTTFGNGSIVDMPDYSVIMAGANYWKDSSPVLHEPNLEKLLKVSHFKEPYVADTQDDELTPDVPAFRFPYADNFHTSITYLSALIVYNSAGIHRQLF